MNKKHLKITAIAFAVWYVVTRPEAAAALVNSTLGGLGGAAESMSRFVSAIP
ncbi:hypothetical protein Acsp03_21500 [Actinomadura sp. NBRC 104412]|uniref:hypothetical protein n=1 Tax=Actinomadura sp. NBRC 104412 TaxID=3032203 RepID=UPI0024A2B812|nr:hypothetical protein [Actinomadura sp. NBRC 104412]GLZ04684.1 hypothetical protein Acsp03_21500 [Actinomadura sp. NBRC 104412]